MSRVHVAAALLFFCSRGNAQYYGPGVYYGPGGYYGGNGGNNNDNAGFGPLAFFGGFDLDKAKRVRFAHGILASLAIVVLFPIGAISIRIIPGRLAVLVHALFQLLAYVLYIVAVGLGIWMVMAIRFGEFDLWENRHPIIGIVVLTFLFFQPILGIVHHLRFKKHGRRSVVSYAHIWIGRIFITIGIINGGLGLQLADNTRSGEIIYAVVAGIIWLMWMLAACFGEARRIRNGRKDRYVEKRHSDESSMRHSPRVRHVDEPMVASGGNAAPRSPPRAAKGARESYA